MSKALNVLEVMSKDNVYSTLQKAISESGKGLALSIRDLDDEDVVAKHCLLIEWVVNRDDLDGFKGVFIEAMEIAIGVDLTTAEAGDMAIAIGEVISLNFHFQQGVDEVDVATVLIPDASYYGFSTESLKPILNDLLAPGKTSDGQDLAVSFVNNSRILDEKINFSKETLAAVHDLLESTYDENLSDELSLANLKSDLKKHHNIVIPDNYYADERLSNEIFVYSAQR